MPNETSQVLSSDASPRATAGNVCGICGGDCSKFFDLIDTEKDPVQLFICPNCLTVIPSYKYQMSEDQVEEKLLPYFLNKKPEWTQISNDLEPMVDFFSGYLDKSLPTGEVGAGHGSLGAALLRKGYDYLGCEPSALCELGREHFSITATQLRKVAFDQYFSLLQQQGIRLGALFVWHVLEHLRNPSALFAQAHAVLKSGGALIGQVPLLVPKEIHVQHLYFFSEKSIRVMAERANFRLALLFYDHNLNFLTFVVTSNN